MESNFLERLMESKWTVRGLALILALLLFAIAYIDEQGTTPIFANNTSRETIEDVPVTVYYEEADFVVTGVPQFVNVTVEGNSTLVRSTKNLRNFIVYVDLTNADLGSQRVRFEYRDISDKLTVFIEPATVVVNVQEKVSEEFTVEGEFNKSYLEEGYTSEQPTVEPRTVTITGGKDTIEQIAYVKATVEVNSNINETFSKDAIISVLDKNLNKIEGLQIEPAQVVVTVPVVSPKKTVPIVIRQTGTPKDGIIIKSIEPIMKEIALFGRLSVLNATNQIELEVDISNIEKNELLTIPIEKTEGIQRITPESVNVQVSIDVEETRTIEGLPIEYTGLDESLEMEFLEPENGQADITVTGPSEIINNLRPEDFRVTINLSGLTQGDYEVDLTINGPLGIEISSDLTKISISVITQE